MFLLTDCHKSMKQLEGHVWLQLGCFQFQVQVALKLGMSITLRNVNQKLESLLKILLPWSRNQHR